ncbi:MAG: type 4a pilus biogenesis protein PilO [Candidatus Gracilibacteria bacterium]
MLYQDAKIQSDVISAPSRAGTLVGVLMVIAAIVGYAFLLQPQADNLASLKADVASKSSQVEELKQKINSFKTAEQTLNLDSQVKKFEILKAVPADVQQDQVIRDLIAIANSYEITLHSLSFSKGVSEQKGVGTLRINSSFEGNYSDLTNFLEGIEKNGRLFRVSSISVQVNNLEATNVQRATFSLSVDSFYSLKN